VMDTIADPDITFNTEGICNYCKEAEQYIPKFKFSNEEAAENIRNLTNKVKAEQTGKYDSIIGLSGGVDSSYVALLAKRMGLNPLCVHFDNGWNSEIAVNNIKKIINVTGFDLHTYVIDWPEFKDLQRSFFKAGVIDIEMLTDHAIMATMFKLRAKNKIRYVLSGTNYLTEHGMPPSWVWNKSDLKNIKDIQKKFGTKKIKAFPTTSILKMIFIEKYGIGGIYAEPLNMINYNKKEAMQELENEFGWQYYGGKHYESVFTKFYQAYVLPVKFKVDKRKVHLSALIRNGEITREFAIAELQKELYKPEELRKDKEYVLKKLDFTETQFDSIMKEAPQRHQNYATETTFINNIASLKRKMFRRNKK